MPYIVLNPAAAQAAPVVTFGAPEAAGAHPAGKSLTQMRARLVRELGNRTDLTANGADFSTVDEWINDSYLDLWTSLDLPETKRSFQFQTAAAQPLYLLPSVIDTIRAVTGSNLDGTPLLGQAFEKTDEFSYRKLPDQTDHPMRWFREQQMLVLWPTPDDVYNIAVDVKVKFQKLANANDYPAIEDKWHEPLFKGAKYRGWEAIQNDTKSLTTMNEMSRLVQRRSDREAGDQAETYPSLRPIRSREELMELRDSRRIWQEPGE